MYDSNCWIDINNNWNHQNSARWISGHLSLIVLKSTITAHFVDLENFVQLCNEKSLDWNLVSDLESGSSLFSRLTQHTIPTVSAGLTPHTIPTVSARLTQDNSNSVRRIDPGHNSDSVSRIDPGHNSSSVRMIHPGHNYNSIRRIHPGYNSNNVSRT